jgi:hypothetical protein
VSDVPRTAKGGLKLVASGVSESLYNFVIDEAHDRSVDISVVVIDALKFYKENNPTPEKIQFLVEQSLEKRLDLLDAALMRLIDSDSKQAEKFADRVAMKIAQRQLSH